MTSTTDTTPVLLNSEQMMRLQALAFIDQALPGHGLSPEQLIDLTEYILGDYEVTYSLKNDPITSPDFLDTLPEGTALLDGDGDVWGKRASTWFTLGGDNLNSEDVFHLYGPLTLLHVPLVDKGVIV